MEFPVVVREIDNEKSICDSLGEGGCHERNAKTYQ